MSHSELAKLDTQKYRPSEFSLEKRWGTALRDLSELFKLRIVFLLLMAALGGSFLAAGGWPGWSEFLSLILAGGSASAGASALNQYFEREMDGTMRRTRGRPLVTGSIEKPHWVLLVGILMAVLPSVLLIKSNPAMALFLISGAVIYAGVYTLWLKSRTPLNIVIGGAAGSAAVLSGGAASMGWMKPEVVTLALLVFLWTPSHFWSLSLLYRKDYEKAGLPMLSAMISPQRAGGWVLLHTLATVLAALVLGASEALSALYMVPVSLSSIFIIWRNLQILQKPSPRRARRLFLGSNTYLMVILLAIYLDLLL